MPRPDKRVSLGDKGPRSAEGEQANALVSGYCTEQIADKGGAPIADEADHRDRAHERERILRNPGIQAARMNNSGLKRKVKAYHSHRKIAVNCQWKEHERNSKNNSRLNTYHYPEIPPGEYVSLDPVCMEQLLTSSCD